MQKSAVLARTSKESDPPQTRKRSGSNNYEALEYTTWQLLTTHQANNNPQHASANKHKRDEIRSALAARALRAETASAISAAFCLALVDDDIKKSFERLLEISTNCPDSQKMGAAHKELLHTTIYYPFVLAPHTLDKEQIHVLYKFAISEACTNNISRMLIGARFETGMELERAAVIYGCVLTQNFSPNSQLANLMRIGEGSPEALYQIGKHILKTSFNVEKFQTPMINFFKTAYARLKADDIPADVQENFDEFFESEDIRWDDIAIMCITLAVYNKKHSLEPAARYLSTLYTQGEVVRKSSQRACVTLEYAYRRSSSHREKERIMTMMQKFHAENSEDLWANSMLASICTTNLKASIDEGDDAGIFDHTIRATEHYLRVYERLFSEYKNFYRESFPLIPELPRNTYDLASVLYKLHDQNRSNTKLGPLLLEQTVTLLKKSGKLGHSKSHYKLARLEVATLKSSSPPKEETLNLVSEHCRCALEGAMVALDLEEYRKILKFYAAFVRKYLPNQQFLVTQYQVREKDLDSNLQVLTLYRDNKYGSSEFKILAANSPMACALDWQNSFFESSYYNRHVELLISRGLHNAKFNDDIVTLLTDYFILATRHPQARVFFPCLKKGLENTTKIDAPLAQEIASVIDFYLNILDGNFLECRGPVERYRESCKKVFERLEQRFLLQPTTYDVIQGILNPISAAPVTFRKGSGPRFFNDDGDAELPEQLKRLPLSARRNLLQSATNSPRDDLFSSGEKDKISPQSTLRGTVSPQPVKLVATKLLADSDASSPLGSPTTQVNELATVPKEEALPPGSQLIEVALNSNIKAPPESQAQEPLPASSGNEPAPSAVSQKKELPETRIVLPKKGRLSMDPPEHPRSESAPADLGDFSPPLRFHPLPPIQEGDEPHGDDKSDEQDTGPDIISPWPQNM